MPDDQRRVLDQTRDVVRNMSTPGDDPLRTRLEHDILDLINNSTAPNAAKPDSIPTAVPKNATMAPGQDEMGLLQEILQAIKNWTMPTSAPRPFANMTTPTMTAPNALKNTTMAAPNAFGNTTTIAPSPTTAAGQPKSINDLGSNGTTTALANQNPVPSQVPEIHPELFKNMTAAKLKQLGVPEIHPEVHNLTNTPAPNTSAAMPTSVTPAASLPLVSGRSQQPEPATRVLNNRITHQGDMLTGQTQPQPMLMFGFVPENQSRRYTCPMGVFTRVQFASYGTPRGSDVTSLKADPQCASNADDTAKFVSDLCVNESECEIPASNKLFGDPCPGTVKHLSVSIVCTPYDLGF